MSSQGAKTGFGEDRSHSLATGGLPIKWEAKTKMPLVSVVVPTFRRWTHLLSTIEDLLRQDYPAFEVIIVDQNSEWPTELINARKVIEADPRIRWLTLDKPGVVRARNFGVNASNGSILLFTDDDVRIPSRHFIAKHAANYDDEGISSVTGREIPVARAQSAGLANRETLSPVPSGECTPRWNEQPAILQALHFSRDSAQRYEVATFCTCNGSILRSEFYRIGGFDENFSGNSYGDDFDLAVRLSESGGRLIYDPQAALIHLQAPAGGLRLKDRQNTFSERDKAISTCLFVMRHSRKGCRWHLFYNHLLRKTILLKRNVICFWQQPIVWWGVASAWNEARRRLREGPRSGLDTAKARADHQPDLSLVSSK